MQPKSTEAKGNFMSYQPMETAPRGHYVSVLTRSCCVRACRVGDDGALAYQSIHREWFPVDSDPPQSWWNGPVPGWPNNGRVKIDSSDEAMGLRV